MISTNINDKSSDSLKKYLFIIITGIITLLVFIFVLHALKLGLFDDKVLLINYIDKYGIWAIIVFIALQLLQVIVPIIPGGISCLAGVLAFGPILGFIYNFIGLSIGSCFAYYISNKYGITLVRKLFKSSIINKYLTYFNNNNFEMFIIGIIFPGFPDDLLCYIAGLSKISFKRFLVIILIGKFISLLFYSLFVNYM